MFSVTYHCRKKINMYISTYQANAYWSIARIEYIILCACLNATFSHTTTVIMHVCELGCKWLLPAIHIYTHKYYVHVLQNTLNCNFQTQLRLQLHYLFSHDLQHTHISPCEVRMNEMNAVQPRLYITRIEWKVLFVDIFQKYPEGLIQSFRLPKI